MAHTRRAVVTGLAALLAITVAKVRKSAAKFSAPDADPVFAAMDRYRRAIAAFATVNEDAEPERYALIEAELATSGEILFLTLPTTHAGAVAFTKFVIEEASHMEDRALGVLREALPRLSPAA
jgi:hypothetical protein